MIIHDPIVTVRLELRNLGSEHASGPYLQWMQDAEILRFLETRPDEHTETSLVEFINDNNHSPDTMLLGMFLRSDDRHIGNIRLGPISERHANAPIGIMIGGRSYWGLGFASEAIRELAEFAHHTYDLRRVYAACFANNMGSANAFIKAGFMEEGRLRDHCRDGEEWVDSVMMGRVFG